MYIFHSYRYEDLLLFFIRSTADFCFYVGIEDRCTTDSDRETINNPTIDEGKSMWLVAAVLVNTNYRYSFCVFAFRTVYLCTRYMKY